MDYIAAAMALGFGVSFLEEVPSQQPITCGSTAGTPRHKCTSSLFGPEDAPRNK